MIDDIKKLILSHSEVVNVISQRANLEDYISKLYGFATILPYYKGSKLKGFIAYYSNDPQKENAFLSILIIDKESAGEGLAKLLLECSVSDLINQGFKNYRLEVLKENSRAIGLYEKFGFTIENESENTYSMILRIAEYAG